MILTNDSTKEWELVNFKPANSGYYVIKSRSKYSDMHHILYYDKSINLWMANYEGSVTMSDGLTWVWSQQDLIGLRWSTFISDNADRVY